MPLKVVRRPKSPYWYLRGTFRGVRIEETTRTTSRTKAEEIRVRRETTLLDEAIHGRKPATSFAGAALAYLDSGGSDRFLDRLVEYYRTTPLQYIDQASIDTAAKTIHPHASLATKNRQIYTPIAAILNYSAKRGWCEKPILVRPKQSKPRIRWLRIEEANSLIDAADDHLKPLLIFLFYTGARVGEAIKLDWSDVDLDRAHVTFPETKNGEPRGVPLHSRVVQALQRYKHRNGRVFLNRAQKPYRLPSGKNAGETSHGSVIRRSFRKAVRAAGLTNLTPHDCRHTFATWHYQKNRDLTALMRLGGWKTMSMVMRYVHSNVEEHKATIDALPGENLGETSNKKKNKP